MFFGLTALVVPTGFVGCAPLAQPKNEGFLEAKVERLGDGEKTGE